MRLAPLSLLLASGMIGAAPAVAQGSPALVEQISVPRGTTPQLGATGSSRNERIAPTAPAQAQQPTGLGAIPPEVIAACESEEDGAQRPEGVDCAALLQQLAQARQPQLSAEMTLLGFGRTDGNAPTATAQRNANSVNADDVARRASSGDVQGAGASDAIGAIVQQGGPR